MNLKKFLKLQEEVQQEQRAYDRDVGALEQFSKQLKEEFDVNIEEAEQLEQKLTQEVNELEQEFDTKLEELEKKWGKTCM